MSQMTLNASQGVHIDGATSGTQQTTNYEAISPQLDVGKQGVGTGERRRALIRFDFSSVPAGLNLKHAKFRFYNQAATSLTNNSRTMRAYRVIRNWVENQCTWLVYSSGNSWGTAGCSNTSTDREASELGTLNVVSPPSAGYMECDFDVNKVKEWINGSFTNNGFIWIMDTESDDMQRFDGESDANPPQLILEYPSPSFLPFFFP